MSTGLIKENGFTLKWGAATTETINNKDNRDDIGLLVNTSAQAKFLPHILEQAARGISFYVNLENIEFMCFKQNEVKSSSH